MFNSRPYFKTGDKSIWYLLKWMFLTHLRRQCLRRRLHACSLQPGRAKRTQCASTGLSPWKRSLAQNSPRRGAQWTWILSEYRTMSRFKVANIQTLTNKTWYKKQSTHFCLTISKHLSMLALVPSMLHTLCSPCCSLFTCLPFRPFLLLPPFFGFTPSTSFEKMVMEWTFQMMAPHEVDLQYILQADLQYDVAPALLLQLLDINSILANQFACG